MPSILEGSLRSQIAKAFKGRLIKGTLRRTSSTGLDSAGDPDGSPTVLDYAFEGIREAFSLHLKATTGIPADDVSILVLQGTLTPATSISRSDEGGAIYLGAPWNKWHRIRTLLEIDPAGATARLQCFEIPTP
jgi:hypothetical protein